MNHNWIRKALPKGGWFWECTRCGGDIPMEVNKIFPELTPIPSITELQRYDLVLDCDEQILRAVLES